MAKNSVKPKPDELRAEQIVNAVLGTVTVERDDNSRPAMPDALLGRADEGLPMAALEVSSTTDRAAMSMWDTLHKEHGNTVHPELDWCWLVNYRPGARVGGKAAKRLVGYLAELELRGVREVRQQPGFVPRTAQKGVTLGDHAELAQLGLVTVSAVDSDSSRGKIFHFDVATGAGCGPGEDVPGYVNAFLAGPTGANKLRKLKAQSEQGNKAHLFIWADPHHVQVGQPLSNAVLPTEPPTVPAFLDGVWLASAFAPEHVYRWTHDSGWDVVEVAPLDLGQDA